MLQVPEARDRLRRVHGVTYAPAATMVTLKDIARQLGAARSAVGRNLAGDARIGPATSARVCATAECMGYVADAPARVMRGGTAPHVAEVTA
jgi:DNA-binding LacI/PurR family transcriptional regulator